MKTNIAVRVAARNELTWINRRYDEVQFVHSDFDNEIIAIAEYEGQRVGLGRLVRIDDRNLELGGIYVFEQHRGKGIAKEIVEFLLRYVPKEQIVYCIPFEHLAPFYRQFGFLDSNGDGAPKKVVEKFIWCQEQYPTPTTLFVLNSASPR